MQAVKQFRTRLADRRLPTTVTARMPGPDVVVGSNEPEVPPGPYLPEVVLDYVARPTGRSVDKQKVARRLGHISAWLKHVPVDGVSMEVLAPRVYDRLYGRGESLGAVNHDLRVIQRAFLWAADQPKWSGRLSCSPGMSPIRTWHPDFVAERPRLRSQIGGWFVRHLGGEFRRRAHLMSLMRVTWAGLLEIRADQFYYDGTRHWLRQPGADGFRENRVRVHPLAYEHLLDARAESRDAEYVFRPLRPQEWWQNWTDAIWHTRLHLLPDDLARGPYGGYWEAALAGNLGLDETRSLEDAFDGVFTREGRENARRDRVNREEELARFEQDREVFSQWIVPSAYQ